MCCLHRRPRERSGGLGNDGTAAAAGEDGDDDDGGGDFFTALERMLRAGMTSSSPPSFAAAEAASGSIELPPLRGGPAVCWHGDEWRNANPLFAKVLSDIVVAFPRPLVGCVRLPGISFITDAGDDVQPEAATNQMFLSNFQRN